MSSMVSNPVVKSPILDTPKQIINKYSSSGWAAQLMFQGIGKQISSPAMPVANTLTQILSIAGTGVMEYLSAIQNVAASRQWRVQLVLDGVIAFDSTSAAAQASSGYGAMLVGSGENYSTSYSYISQAFPFKASCVLNISSNVVESAGAYLCETRYHTT